LLTNLEVRGCVLQTLLLDKSAYLGLLGRVKLNVLELRLLLQSIVAVSILIEADQIVDHCELGLAYVILCCGLVVGTIG
jgi:hypothetical protein